MVKTRTHFLSVVPILFLWGVLLVLSLLAGIAVHLWVESDTTVFQFIFALCGTISVTRILWSYLHWRHFELRVAGRMITIQQGWPWTQVENLELTGAQIALHQDLLDHLLDKGSIVLLTAAGNEIQFRNLCHFGQIKGLLAQGI